MAKYQIKIGARLDESLQQLFALQSSADKLTVSDYLSHLVEVHIVSFRQSQLATKKAARETFLHTGEDYRPVERRRCNSPATVQRVLFLLGQNIMPKQVSERLGVSEQTVYRIRAAHAEAEHTRIRGSRRASGTHGTPMVINYEKFDPEKATQR